MGQEVTDIAQSIADKGVTLILAAIFVYASIRFIDILIQYVKRRLDEKFVSHDKYKKLEARNAASDQIQKMIQDTLNMSKYQRIQVIEFSNSVKSIANLPFKYMSCTYEVVPLGSKAAGHKIDRVSTSLFTAFFSKMAKEEYVVIDKKAEVDSHFVSALSDLMDEDISNGCMFDMMLTLKGKAIGYIMITKGSEVTAEDIQNIQLLSNKISALLSVLDK